MIHDISDGSSGNEHFQKCPNGQDWQKQPISLKEEDRAKVKLESMVDADFRKYFAPRQGCSLDEAI